MTRVIAFFDVDETLLAAKSMVSFWHFWSAGRTGGPRATLRTTGADRATLNRAYFEHFAGVPAARLEEEVRHWYAVYRRGPEAFLSQVLGALIAHHGAGHDIALVSGSSTALLAPVAEEVGAHHVLATEQLTDAAGVLTGAVRRSVIGPVKEELMADLLDRTGVRARDCYAYADHAGDLPMLAMVGHPAVVGDDPVLTRHGKAAGWRFLTTRRGPAPTARGELVPTGRGEPAPASGCSVATGGRALLTARRKPASRTAAGPWEGMAAAARYI
ncbi:HAD family hydrolase [Streptomyces hebeiensis]